MWWETVCILDAPTPRAAVRGSRAARRRWRGARGDDDRRQRHQRQLTGRDEGAECGRPAKLMKTAEAEKTEHDRRNRRKVDDVDLDDVGQAGLLGREFFAGRSSRGAERNGARSSTVIIMNSEPMMATPIPADSGPASMRRLVPKSPLLGSARATSPAARSLFSQASCWSETCGLGLVEAGIDVWPLTRMPDAGSGQYTRRADRVSCR